MRPQLAILDFTQTLLGPAIALARQGVGLRYFAPDIRAGNSPSYRKVLLDRYLAGGDAEPCFDADRVIYVESFSDGWNALRECQQVDAPVFAADPFRASIHPLQLEVRLDAIAARLEACSDLVVVDMSDLAEPMHPAFTGLPGRKLKRELLPRDAERGIAPFPFLYNPVLLALDYAWGLGDCRVTDSALAWDGWFCGTIDHPRYGGARRAALAALVARHPQARFGIYDGGIDTLENLRQVQRARTVLHPPGRGTICFRTHEAARFGVPMLVAERPKIVLPADLQSLFLRDLEQLAPSRNEVLRRYAEFYSPEAASRHLQDTACAPTYAAPFATTPS